MHTRGGAFVTRQRTQIVQLSTPLLISGDTGPFFHAYFRVNCEFREIQLIRVRFYSRFDRIVSMVDFLRHRLYMLCVKSRFGNFLDIVYVVFSEMNFKYFLLI